MAQSGGEVVQNNLWLVGGSSTVTLEGERDRGMEGRGEKEGEGEGKERERLCNGEHCYNVTLVSHSAVYLNVIASLETGYFEVRCGSFRKMNYQQPVWKFPVLVHYQYVCEVSLNSLNNYLLHINVPP